LTFSDIEVIHALHNALNIAENFDEELPDITLLDINMPGRSGIDALKEISQSYPGVQCIMPTINADLETVVTCMQYGVKGYLIKDKDSIIKIAESLRTLYSGNYNEEFLLNGTLANKVLHFLYRKKKRRMLVLMNINL